MILIKLKKAYLSLGFLQRYEYFKKTKNEISDLVNQTVKILTYWKDLKPIIGIIEDFFKVAKEAFGLGEFHSLYRKING